MIQILRDHFLAHSKAKVLTSKVYLDGWAGARDRLISNMKAYFNSETGRYFFASDIPASMRSDTYSTFLVLDTEPNNSGGGCPIVTRYVRTFCACQAKALGACLYGAIALFLMLSFPRAPSVQFPSSNQFMGVAKRWKQERSQACVRVDLLRPIELHAYAPGASASQVVEGSSKKRSAAQNPSFARSTTPRDFIDHIEFKRIKRADLIANQLKFRQILLQSGSDTSAYLFPSTLGHVPGKFGDSLSESCTDRIKHFFISLK